MKLRVLLALLFSSSNCQPAKAPAPVTDADFAVAGLRAGNDLGVDSNTVRGLKGAPDSIVFEKNPFDVGAQLAAWYYPSLVVAFGSEGRLVGLSITGDAVTTRRGLRVGDASARVVALYGTPAHEYEGDWDYPDPAGPEGLHVIRVSIRAGVVTRVFIGTLLD